MTNRMWQRAATSATSDHRRITGERPRGAALEAALHLGSTAAPLIALSAVSDAVAITDRHGIVVHANPAWLELLGYSELAQALIGHPIGALLQVPQDARTILSALRHAPTWCGSLALHHESGRSIPVELTVTPVVEVEPHASHFVLVARRLGASEATMSPELLLESVGRLASEIAHDFNNQIAVVLNYTFILLRQLGEPSPLKEHVAEMQEAAWRASQIAQELLAFGGPRITDLESLDLNEVVHGMKDLVRHALHDSVEIDLRLAPALLRVRARLPHLEWTLLELALHARRTLGAIELCCVDTWNEGADGGERFAVVRVRITRSPRDEDRTLRHALGGRALPEEANAMPGVELMLAHAHGTLETARGDNAMTYVVRVPAEA